MYYKTKMTEIVIAKPNKSDRIEIDKFRVASPKILHNIISEQNFIYQVIKKLKTKYLIWTYLCI